MVTNLILVRLAISSGSGRAKAITYQGDLLLVGAVMVPLAGYKWLEVVPEKRNGRPTIRGTRVTVDDIIDMLAAGWRPEEVVEELEIPLEAVHEALTYASETVKGS